MYNKHIYIIYIQFYVFQILFVHLTWWCKFMSLKCTKTCYLQALLDSGKVGWYPLVREWTCHPGVPQRCWGVGLYWIPTSCKLGYSAHFSTLLPFCISSPSVTLTIEAKLSGGWGTHCLAGTCTIWYFYTGLMSASQNHNPLSTVIEASRYVFCYWAQSSLVKSQPVTGFQEGLSVPPVPCILSLYGHGVT